MRAIIRASCVRFGRYGDNSAECDPLTNTADQTTPGADDYIEVAEPEDEGAAALVPSSNHICTPVNTHVHMYPAAAGSHLDVDVYVRSYMAISTTDPAPEVGVDASGQETFEGFSA